MPAAVAIGKFVPKQRAAFVWGNNAYPAPNTLQKCINDANAMATLLDENEYDVTLVKDAKGRHVKLVFEEFVAKLIDGCQVVVHYSGHGCEMGGVNYLVPVDGRATSSDGAPLCLLCFW